MSIPIDYTNELNDAIKATAGKAAHYIHTAKEVQDQCREMLDRMHKHLPPGMLVGSAIVLSSKPQLPRSYGAHQVIFTKIIVDVGPTGLEVTSITRQSESAVFVPPPRVRIVLPAPVKEFLKNQLLQQIINIE